MKALAKLLMVLLMAGLVFSACKSDVTVPESPLSDKNLTRTDVDDDDDSFTEDDGDCDDGDASINPDAQEITGDGIDQDCDGVLRWMAGSQTWAITEYTSDGEGEVEEGGSGTKTILATPPTATHFEYTASVSVGARGNTGTAEYDLDLASKTVTLTSTQGSTSRTTTYTFDSDWRKISEETAAGTTTYEYLPNGKLAKRTLQNGIYSEFSYDNSGRLVKKENFKSDGELDTSAVYTYFPTTGKLGSIKIYEGDSDTAGEDAVKFTRQYVYDDLGRIKTYAAAKKHDGTSNLTNLINYAFDASGRIIKIQSAQSIAGGFSTAIIDTGSHFSIPASMGWLDQVEDPAIAPFADLY